MNQKMKNLPGWAAPVAVIIIVLILAAIGRKNKDAIENPLVDIAIITFGVFAMAAVFRFAANHLNSPGMASFFAGGATTVNNSVNS